MLLLYIYYVYIHISSPKINLYMSEKSSKFVPEMRKIIVFCIAAIVFAACNRPSRVEQYRAEKHKKDSVALFEQQRSLAYYQSQLDALMPVADSLLALFLYEKNDKYQDHGYYIVRTEKLRTRVYDYRVMVRDDGADLLVYRDGKRQNYPDMNLKGGAKEAVGRAEHLQIVIKDIRELEKRIRKTSLEVQKYEKRLEKDTIIAK